jgi:SAM-dependent methyltransferase
MACAAMASPMDSVRYFELDFAWASASRLEGAFRYLDVSSPRLFPVTLLRSRAAARADLLNPDPTDLEATRALVQAAGLAPRCTLRGVAVEGAPFRPGTFDLVTSLSVVEHIPSPGDSAAAGRMWEWLRPGGRLVISVPCAREGFEEYLDVDPYGLLPPAADGFWFGQRFYDQAALEDRLYRVLGEPGRLEVFGERRPGAFFAARDRKALGTFRWAREPWVVATDYRRFGSVSELPGIGVIAMEFVKPG